MQYLKNFIKDGQRGVEVTIPKKFISLEFEIIQQVINFRGKVTEGGRDNNENLIFKVVFKETDNLEYFKTHVAELLH